MDASPAIPAPNRPTAIQPQPAASRTRAAEAMKGQSTWPTPCAAKAIEAEAERRIGRCHDAEIGRAFAQHIGIVAEQRQPERWIQRDNEADRARQRQSDERAGPGDPSR